MADRFYVNSPLAPGSAVLQGPEVHHLANVLRTKPGTAVCLFNGDGAEYPATVVEIAKRSVSFDVGPPLRPVRELRIDLEIAAPLPKGDRGDFLIEKLTELGVRRFVPLRTRRSVVHPRTERLERAVIEASKQCGRNVLMGIDPVMEWERLVGSTPRDIARYLAHPLGSALQPVPQCHEPERKRCIVAIGPEGGFTDEEVERARTADWQIVALGPRILRVETAAIALAGYFGFSS